MVLDFEEMRRIYRLEKSTSRLVDVPEDFFSQLHGLIDEERKKYFDSLKDLNATRARDFGNLKKLIDEWFVVREKKLLNHVLVSARVEEADHAHMSAEEKQLFGSVLTALTHHRETTKRVLEANGEFVSIAPRISSPQRPLPPDSESRIAEKEKSVHTVPPSSPSVQASEVLSIRILSEIPSFVGTDMKEYGPYKQGQVVELPGKIANLFISRKLGEGAG